MDKTEIRRIELDLACKAIYRRYGVDLQNYSQASLQRRFDNIMNDSQYNYLSDLISPLLHDEKFFYSILPRILVSVTEMFRDPSFFISFRKKVIPMLRTYPFIKIWHAGCASGEEVYSMAILLHEEGLLEKTTLYGTDINMLSLDKAQKGVYTKEELQKASANYRIAGGKKQFSHYFTHKYELGKIFDSLRRNIVFSSHNLVSDGIFGEMHVIICKNVFIYFNRELQNKILKLFSNSLVNRGYLCIGPQETLEFSVEGKKFDALCEKERIFQKKSLTRSNVL